MSSKICNKSKEDCISLQNFSKIEKIGKRTYSIWESSKSLKFQEYSNLFIISWNMREKVFVRRVQISFSGKKLNISLMMNLSIDLINIKL